jgi:hypothetical protein
VSSKTPLDTIWHIPDDLWSLIAPILGPEKKLALLVVRLLLTVASLMAFSTSCVPDASGKRFRVRNMLLVPLCMDGFVNG